MGIMFAADELVGLPFLPYDLFDWVTRVLPGPIVTFGIDMMIDTMRLLNISGAYAAKTAEKAISIIQFFLMEVVAGGLFFAFRGLRRDQPDVGTGLSICVFSGLPMIAISLAIDGSTVESILVIMRLAVIFLA
jgi:hypothetical protein